MIKRFFLAVIFVFSLLFLCVFTCSAVDISADSAIVMNAVTGEIVYEKNSQKVRSMASTTKIMTAVLAIESGKLYETVSVCDNINIEGTSIGIKKGYKYKLIDLVYGMLLESGNDAAYVVSEYLCGSEEKFADRMNRKSESIGMKNTNFVTASGLDDENHYTTAYDMALLGCYAIKNKVFREICSTKNKSISLIEPQITVNLSNHNRLLKSFEGTIGIKTGFTKKSGRCLVSACERNGATYVAVTLNAPDDWNDHRKLYEYCFENTVQKTINVTTPKKVNLYGGISDEAFINDVEIKVNYISEPKYKVSVLLPKIIYAPIECEDVVGKIRITFENNFIFETNITAAQNVDILKINNKPKRGIIDFFINFFTN